MGRILLLMIVSIALGRINAVDNSGLLLTIDQFNANIIDRVLLSKYFMDYRSDDSDIPDGHDYVFRFEAMDNGNYSLAWSMIQSHTGECFKRDEQYFTDGDAAILKHVTYNENDAEKFKSMSFVSSCPDKYVLLGVCYGRRWVDGGCPDAAIWFLIQENVYDTDIDGVLDDGVEIPKADMLKDAISYFGVPEDKELEDNGAHNDPECRIA